MSWRVQKDDPIEKCEEAKYKWVWVVFKENPAIDTLERPWLCRAMWSIEGVTKSVRVMDLNEISLPVKYIDRWKLILTPAMPERFLSAKEIEQVTTQYNNMNKKS